MKLLNRNFLLSLVAAVAFLLFHFTTVLLPIVPIYPERMVKWISFQKVVWDSESLAGWAVVSALATVNFLSFLILFFLLTRWKLRTRIFLFNCYGLYPTLIISTLYMGLWNIPYLIVLWKAIKRTRHEFLPFFRVRSLENSAESD